MNPHREPHQLSGPPGAVPPGWYRDPSGAPHERWWDGAAWGHQTRPGPSAAGPPAAARTAVKNPAATAGLVLGVIALFANTLMVTSLLGIVFSIMGLTRAAAHERAGSRPVGRARAIGGLVLSVLGGSTTLFFKALLF